MNNKRKAEELGRAAYLAGRERTPVLDRELLPMFAGRPVGSQATTNELAAWLRGWDNAHFEDEANDFAKEIETSMAYYLGR